MRDRVIPQRHIDEFKSFQLGRIVNQSRLLTLRDILMSLKVSSLVVELFESALSTEGGGAEQP